MDDLFTHLLSDDDEEEAVIEVCLAAATAGGAALEPVPAVWGGRQVGSASNISRGACSWFADYLSSSPRYTSSHFRGVFRVPLRLYHVLERELPLVDPTLLQRTDCTGRRGHPFHVKILNSLRRLGTGRSFRDLDDHSRMSVEAQRQAFVAVLRAVRSRFGPQFLNRHPTAAELAALTDSFAARGLPGCMGSVDCMKIKWKNCPRAFKGQYHNPKDGKLAVLSCQALVDGDLYCWDRFAGRPGTNNDITVASHSPLFSEILCGRRCIHLPGGYVLNGIRRSWPLYILGDSIYPRWAIFFLPGSGATSEKEIHAKKCQEAIRKDVERFFGCLQGRFRILRQDREEWSDELILLDADVCIILHN